MLNIIEAEKLYIWLTTLHKIHSISLKRTSILLTLCFLNFWSEREMNCLPSRHFMVYLGFWRLILLKLLCNMYARFLAVFIYQFYAAYLLFYFYWLFEKKRIFFLPYRINIEAFKKSVGLRLESNPTAGSCKPEKSVLTGYCMYL